MGTLFFNLLHWPERFVCIFAGEMGFCLCSEGGVCLPGNGAVL